MTQAFYGPVADPQDVGDFLRAQQGALSIFERLRRRSDFGISQKFPSLSTMRLCFEYFGFE